MYLLMLLHLKCNLSRGEGLLHKVSAVIGLHKS